MPAMSLVSFFFGFSGRIGRRQWWLGMLAVALATGLMLWIAFRSDYPAAGLPLVLPVFVSTYALSVKRLHDRGKSGWWALVFIFLPGVADRWSDRLTEESPLWWVLVLAGSALTIWALIELGFRRGTDGDNDYGPSPLVRREPAIREHAAG